MAEPHSSVAIGVGIGAATSIPLVLFGAHVDALVLGMFAAIGVSIWMPAINSRARSASAIVMSSLFAGYGSPAAAAWVASNIQGMPTASDLRMLLALLIGAAAPSLVPAILKRGQKEAMSGGKARD